MTRTKTVAEGSREFAFDMNARLTRKSDHDLLSALEDYAKVVGYRYFQTREFDKWAGRRCHSGTVTERFGSWKKALSIIGVEGGHKEEYTVEELISNLEVVWKEVGRPPGHQQISKMGAKISDHPYRRIWGSVRKACIAISRFHRWEITRSQLLEGNTDIPQRRTIPLDVRWKVLKRDNYRCVVCGANPASNHSVELHIDHIIPVVRGGTNDLSNLRMLCDRCNLGKGGE